MVIDSDFEGGRVEVVRALDAADIQLSVPPDPKDTRFRQWFSFVVAGKAGEAQSLRIVNAGRCTWARSFGRYHVCASEDGQSWLRIPSVYDGECLSFSHVPEGERVHYAYFAPYGADRLEALLGAAESAGARRSVAAASVQGRPVPMLSFGRPDEGARRLWIIAQQHPGEPMAGWFMEGLIARLLSDDDEARALLDEAELCLVPRMNPDGCAVGNHRTNAAGADLNRHWAEPGPEAPEVLGVRAQMIERGVDFFLDVHGDEALPYVFAQGTDGIPQRTSRIEALEERFAQAMLDASPEFQTEHGYPRELPSEGNMRIAANYVGNAFDCLSLTLEMPFTDNANAPDERAGWSPERSRKLGDETVDALIACLPHLR